MVLASGSTAASDSDNDKIHNSSATSAKISACDKVLSANRLKSISPNSKANTILSTTLNPTTKVNTSATNGSRRGQPSSPSRYSLAGDVNLTKQQFREQIQERRAKR